MRKDTEACFVSGAAISVAEASGTRVGNLRCPILEMHF